MTDFLAALALIAAILVGLAALLGVVELAARRQSRTTAATPDVRVTASPSREFPPNTATHDTNTQ